MTHSAEIESRILQHKLGRFYFAVGRETNVYPGNAFAIVCGGDTILTGIITGSYTGVSYSDTKAQMHRLPLYDSCYARLQQAAVDSGATIKLVACRMDSPGDLVYESAGKLNPDPQTELSIPSGGHVVILNTMSGPLDPAISLELGEIDGFFAYRNRARELGAGRVIDTEAPHIAMVIPNISRVVNRDGMLTTSLYFRFGENRLPVIFDGDNVRPVYCLVPAARECHRPFPYDPAQGRALVQHLPQQTGVVRIAVTRRSLAKVAYYFADVLSRDRIPVEIVDKPADADLFITYVPNAGGDPVAVLEAVCRVLKLWEPATLSQRETLDGIFAYLDSGRVAADSALGIRFCKLAERELIDNLGVFPLFVPRIFFHASERLRDFEFREDGTFDFARLTKLKLPAAPERQP